MTRPIRIDLCPACKKGAVEYYAQSDGVIGGACDCGYNCVLESRKFTGYYDSSTKEKIYEGDWIYGEDCGPTQVFWDDELNDYCSTCCGNKEPLSAYQCVHLAKVDKYAVRGWIRHVLNGSELFGSDTVKCRERSAFANNKSLVYDKEHELITIVDSETKNVIKITVPEFLVLMCAVDSEVIQALDNFLGH